MDKNFPEKSIGDNSYAIAKGIISAIPIAGGSLSVLFESIFTTPLDKRKKEWFLLLADAIEDLTKKIDGITPESLSKNEIFISVSMEATQIALRNHQQEKLNALKNAVKSSAISISIDENKILMFTKIIDDMTPLHLKILKFLSNPNIIEQKLHKRTPPNIRINYGDNMKIWKEYYPGLSSSRDLIIQITKELYVKGFLYNENAFHTLGKSTSNFADDFLDFISES